MTEQPRGPDTVRLSVQHFRDQFTALLRRRTADADVEPDVTIAQAIAKHRRGTTPPD